MSQIEFKKVSKIYENGYQALKKVSFSIEPGEFVFIVGPSGAGKSTLIKMLIREDIPTSGEVLFNGQSIPDTPREELPELRRKIGVVFQDFKVLPSKTVRENVAVALEVADASDETMNEVIPNVLNLVGMQKKLNYFPYQLSGGEKQRLAIARALAHEPDVLIADEPTGMIDPVATDEVLTVLKKINDLGTTIVMATHNSDIVNKMKKRVIRLENSKIVFDKAHTNYDGK